MRDLNMSESLWHGFSRLDFSFCDREAVLIFPEKAAAGRPWAQYTEYFDAFPATALGLVEQGYHLAFLKNRHRWGNEEDYLLKQRFGVFLEEQYGLSQRTTLLGMSCGGMIAVHMAVRFPETVEALYLDAPVMDLRSCPLALGAARRDDALVTECLEALGMTESELLAFRGNPLDKLPRLVAARIPVALVYGGRDLTVPYAENGALLERAYKTAGCPIRVWKKPECGHHPHGLADPTPVIEQLERWRTQ